MKLRKAIRLHRKIRRRQEYLSYKVTQWPRIIAGTNANHIQSVYLDEYCAVNNAVRKLNRLLPWYYFFLSDVFGFARSLRYVPPKPGKIPDIELFTWDLISDPGFKI